MDAAALLCDSMHKKRRKVVQTGDPCSICFLLTSLLILFHSFSIHFLLTFYSFSTAFYSFPTPLWGDEKSWKIIGNRVFSNSLIAGHYKGMLKIIGNRIFCKFPIRRTVFNNCKKFKISEFSNWPICSPLKKRFCEFNTASPHCIRIPVVNSPKT